MFRTQAVTGWSWVILSLALVGCQPDGDQQYTDRMEEEHEGDVPEPTDASQAAPDSEVVSEAVVYATVDGEPVEGYLAKPAGAERAPGIIVIQEWWGLNDNIRSMADRLAGEGYTALAVDLYDGEVAEDPDTARTLMEKAMENRSWLEGNLRQAYDYLENDQRAPKIGTIGWCFGGGWSLNAALLLPDEIDATVIYYGRLVTDPEQLKVLEMPILGIFGAEDQGIPVESVREFEEALASLDKDAAIHVYEGADHAFANPSGQRYEPEAAQDAWEKTLSFFEEHLKGE